MSQPPRAMQASSAGQGYPSNMHQPASSSYYPPNTQQTYDNRYYNVPQTGHQSQLPAHQAHQQGHQRYGPPPPSSYGVPPPPQMYMNPQQPMGRGMPGGGMYPPQNITGGYSQAPMSHLNQYEEQLFNEAIMLLNQIKTSGLSEGEMSAKKNRLNYILSSHPKVHQKLKESLPQKS